MVAIKNMLKKFIDGRYFEALLMVWFPLIGIIFAFNEGRAIYCQHIILLLLGYYLLSLHIYFLNDLFEKKQRIKKEIIGTWLSLVIGLLFIWQAGGLYALFFGILQAIASFIYSYPRFHGKGIPGVATFLHFIGGWGAVNLGYVAVADTGYIKSMLLGVYYAILFCAGHINHEIRDYEEDLLNKIGTVAVLVGKNITFWIGLVFFSIANIYIAIIGFLWKSSMWLFVILALVWGGQLIYSILIFRLGMPRNILEKYQILYRLVYAISGIIILGML